MAKAPLKKAAPKKAAKKATPKKTASKKSPAKKTAKKAVSEKELLQKEANRLIHSSKKTKTTRRPKKHATEAQTTTLLDAVVDGMQEKKAKNITVINLQRLENRVCDYFVICDADSTTHVDAIAGSLEDVVEKKTKETPYHSEGFQNSEWIIVDYINIVAHIFLKEKREFYNIEGLWADGEFTHIN